MCRAVVVKHSISIVAVGEKLKAITVEAGSDSLEWVAGKAGEEFELEWDRNVRKVTSDYMYTGSVRDTRKCIINDWFGRTFRIIADRNRRCVWPVMSGWRAWRQWFTGGQGKKKKNGSVLFRRATSSTSLNRVICMCTLSVWLYSRAAGTPGPLRGFQRGPRQTRNTFGCDLVHWRT